MASRKVTITLTGRVLAKYEARSYPDDDRDNNGLIDLYDVPVYEILIDGTDDAGSAKTIKHQAPRFMPFYNDPRRPDPHYSHRGWANAGLSSKRTIVVPQYKATYEVRNRYSPGKGAIVMVGAFYIHAGPADLTDFGFGSAGCVEIVGDYDVFKADIASLSGTGLSNSDQAITQLVKDKKLIVKVEHATPPDIRKSATRQFRVTP